MSSMSFCTTALRISDFSSGRAFARSTGCPMRATFRIDISKELYWQRAGGPRDGTDPPPTRRLARLSVLPSMRRRARAPSAEADRAGTAGLHALRLRLLHRSEDRRRHDHPKLERPAGARPARDRTGLRQVGVSRRLRRPRRTADGGRHPRGARRMRPRRAARRPRQHLLLPRPRAGHRRLRRHGDRRRRCASTRSASRAPSSTARASRGIGSRSAARTKDCAITWTARAIRFPPAG